MLNELDIKNLPLLTVTVPNGESPMDYLEDYLGVMATPATEMPSEVDVDATVFIEFK